MNVGIAVFAAIAGYLAGSVLFAPLVFRVLAKRARPQVLQLAVPGTSEMLSTTTASATAVRLQFGTRYGCLTSILDMAKAAGVTLAFKLAYPQTPYFLIASGCAVVGHVWPLLYRFRGGRGQSPTIGGLFAVDWASPLIAYPVAQLLGLLTGSRAYVGRFSPLLIAAVWLYFRFRSAAYVCYALGIFAVRLLAMRSEIRQFSKLRKAGHLRTLKEEAELLGFDSVFRALKGGLRRLRFYRHP